MERILVSMDCWNGCWGALSRAISLAGRIDAKLYALLVLPPSASGSGKEELNAPCMTRERIELLIEIAKSEGSRIDYFISEGDYEEEVIRFVEQNRITLVIAESPDAENPCCERDLAQIRRIRHRISCRLEVVSPRKTQNLEDRRK
ncbi:MAG TPA: universal stress protein [Syntrophobacteraceae bacterium]|nr:universal stress protein [Syntrophobacteraceae bacterium]